MAAAIPLSIVALAFMADSMGHQWNIHGDAVLVMGLVLVASVVAFVVEVVTLPRALKRLYRVRTERTMVNYLSTAAAGGFIIACLFYGTQVARTIAAS